MDPRIKMQQIGQTMYGNRWKSSLSRGMSVDPKTIHRLLSGERYFPKDLSSKLLQAIQLEQSKINKAMEIITSDRICRDDITEDVIKYIASRFEYLSEKDYKSAINSIHRAVHDTVPNDIYLSDLEAIALRYSTISVA